MQVGVRETVFGAFRRSSSALSIIIIVCLATTIISTAYNMMAYTREEFIERPDVKRYENEIEKLPPDEWALTQHYWSHNLGVAGIYALGAPSYIGFGSVLVNSFGIGVSTTYWYHQGGERIMLAFSAMIFVHGLLELTGLFLIAAASFRLAWNFWRGLGGLEMVPDKKKKQEILKHKHAIKMLLADFVTLFAIGAFLIFLAAPVEAYISPAAGGAFVSEPAAAVAFLVEVGLIYSLIAALGFARMRIDLKNIWNEVKPAFRRKWRPTQLALLVFILCSAAILLRVIFW
jgi:uncharacterized membrane protein SpoIIM required for sporulation